MEIELDDGGGGLNGVEQLGVVQVRMEGVKPDLK